MAIEKKISYLIVIVVGMIAVAFAPVPATLGGPPDTIPGPVPARVLNVIDGDTLVIRARIWLGQEVETRVRLEGVDTPELRAKCARERDLALKAREFVLSEVDGQEVILRQIRFGKYAGRVLARVSTSRAGDLTPALIKAGLGRVYAGGKRRSWCETKRRE